MPKCNFNRVALLEITLRHGCSPVNLLNKFLEHHLLRTPLDGCFWIYLISYISCTRN